MLRIPLLEKEFWFLGFLAFGFLASKFIGYRCLVFSASCFLFGFIVSTFAGSRDSWFLDFDCSWFIGFRNFKVSAKDQ